MTTKFATQIRLLPILLFACLLGKSTLCAQNLQDFEDDQIAYEFKTDLVLYEYDMYGGKKIADQKQIAKYGNLFYLNPGVMSDTQKVAAGGLGEYYVIKIAHLKHDDQIDYKINNGVLEVIFEGDTGSVEASYLSGFTRAMVYGVRDAAAVSKKTADSLKAAGAALPTPDYRIYRKYFCLKASDLAETKVRKKYATMKPMLSVGTLLVPIKIRPGVKRTGATRVPFDFSTDVTLGTSAGLRLRLSHYRSNYFNLLGGIGITSVSVDSGSTKGIVKASNTNLAAFTMTGGTLFEFEGFQFGLFVGADFIGKSISIDGKSAWDYQGKPWLAVGMGYQIISRSDEKNGK